MKGRTALILAALIAVAAGNAPLNGQEAGGMMGFEVESITTGVHSEVPAFLDTDWRSDSRAGAFISVDPAPALPLRADFLYARRGFGFRMYEETAGLIPGEAEVRSMELQVDVGLGWPS